MLKIRLRRVGKKNQPSYRVVVVEHTAPIQGSYLESVGNYNPREGIFTVNDDRVLHWLNYGAQPSERIAKLLTSKGMTHKLITLPDYTRKPKRPSKSAQPEAPTAKAEKTDEPIPAQDNPEESIDVDTTPVADEGGSNPEPAETETGAEKSDEVTE